MREGRGRGWPGPRVGSTGRGPSWEVGCGLWEGASLTAPSGPPRHQGAHCGEVVPPRLIPPISASHRKRPPFPAGAQPW